MFVQAYHLAYFNFGRQRQKVFTPTVLLHGFFFPVMSSNLLTGIQSAPCVLRGSFSTSHLTQQFKKYSQMLSRKARCSICVTHTWQFRNMYTCISHQDNLHLLANRPKLTQINVHAPSSLTGCTEVSGHFVALRSAARAFRYVFNTQLPPRQSELLCVLALNECGHQTGYIPRLRLGISISNRLMLMLIF